MNKAPIEKPPRLRAGPADSNHPFQFLLLLDHVPPMRQEPQCNLDHQRPHHRHADNRMRVIQVSHIPAQLDTEAHAGNGGSVGEALRSGMEPDAVRRVHDEGAERGPQSKREGHEGAMGNVKCPAGAGGGGDVAEATSQPFCNGFGLGGWIVVIILRIAASVAAEGRDRIAKECPQGARPRGKVKERSCCNGC